MVEGQKKAVVVTLSLRYKVDEHLLYPLYGQLYEQGYLHADRGVENLYLLTDPLPEGTDLGDEETQGLKDLGYEVEVLEAVYTDDSLTEIDHYQYVAV